MSKIKKGMDISYFQGNVDFEAVKRSGVDFAIIRSSYRNVTDEKFFEYVNGCQSAGIRVLGIYHFIYGLNAEEAKKEAKLAIKNAKAAGLSKDTYIFSDFEYDSVQKAAQKGVLLNRSECNAFTVEFCEEVLSAEYKTGIYTNLDYYKNWYYKEVLEKYPIWLADYSGDPDFPCMIQQYTSKGNVPGIKGNVDLDYCFDDDFQNDQPAKNVSTLRSRSKVVNLINSWLGKSEENGQYKEIIDIYNSYWGIFPRGVKMQYDWAWCAATWSALAIKLGYTDIMPIEISCYYIIEAAKKMDCWVENDGYIPKPGDGVLYDWQDNGVGDNTGIPDHIGTITYVNETEGYMTVAEGNYDNAVKKRTIAINGKFIRGFITPHYDDDSVIVESQASPKKDIKVVAKEVISGLWGTGEARKKALTASGYNYEKVQKKVNKILNTPKENVNVEKANPAITATEKAMKFDKQIAGRYRTSADLYCRNGAGTNKKALCLIPKGMEVTCYGYYSLSGVVNWLYITFVLNGISYTGFSSGNYLKR